MDATTASLVHFDRIRPVVEEIARAIEHVAPHQKEPAGLAGGALFLAYLAQATGDSATEAAAARMLEQACQGALKQSMLCTLYGGFLGVAWARAHLSEAESDDGVEKVVERALRAGWEGDYDLIRGLVGVGVYALERRANGSTSDLLKLVVDRLAERAQRRQPGIAWLTEARFLGEPGRDLHPEGRYDLGMAHGLPGAIALLAGAHAAGIAQARPLLDHAVEFLLAQQLPAGSASRFPACVEMRQPCRAAWCYGDPGVAMALLVAARAAREPAWEREAVELARLAARRPATGNGVRDAGLCHGSAGLAHIFHRFWRATGDSCFRDAALAWLRATLAMRKEGVGVAGYRALDTNGWVDDPWFLTGATGIGLALLASASDIEPAWDRLLLCSLAV
ncbi:MAG TPA: lanthionine synthetase C family protein [Polyangia bacterium]|nr:lanthionine synthetase C family protein [Polyangia bacterium]